MLECKICGCKFNAVEERHYISRDKGIEATDTGNIIKYACRWKQKNGIQDLEKIMWYTQHLIDHLRKLEKENENYEK